ncbi:hypothetical protein PFICI_08794 [Pestalotiopsis fici W106-1]|uniref:Bromo domain-containing protein n=1 Tax=Pestalotiopsis fici (strain W106-1 / CGMCC3.15140) TaxID=1229662 RepID=W3X199_PESFW|nr:uncharacterized protein PFICI_08794 [Pestalotiopsis fici W106-1]ETS78941.1 hypothetical protein PFICI_08794 [Pestalotiopsis fici W106-1]
MNHTATENTPIESLFLFILLAKHGINPEAFPRISDELKQNGFINLQDSYDAERLSPEKLEQLAHRLVREDQVRELGADDKTANGGNLSPTSRKRKLPSPSPSALKDIEAHREKLPQLVDRLHTRYQEHIIRRIREDEEALDRLEREIKDLEAPPRPQPTLPAAVAPAAAAPATASPVPRQTPNVPRPNGAPPVVDTKAVQPPRLNGHPNHTPVPIPAAQAQSIAKAGPASHPPLPSQPALERKPSQASPSPIPTVVRPPGDVRQVTQSPRPNNINRPPSAPPSGLQHPQAAPAYSLPPRSGTPQPPTPDGLQRPHGIPKSQSPAPHASPQLQQPQTPGTYKWEPPFNPQHPPYNGQTIARPPSYQNQPQPGLPQHPHPHPHVQPQHPHHQPHPHLHQQHAQHPQHPQHPQAQYGNRQPSQPHIQPHMQPGRTPTPGNGPYAQPVLVPPQGPVQNAGQTPPPPRQTHQDVPVQQAQPYRHPAVNASGPATAPAIPSPQYAQQQPQLHPGQPGQPGARQQVLPSQTHPAGRGFPVAPPAGHRPPLAAPVPPGQHPNVQSHSLPSTPIAQRSAQQPFPQQPPHPGAQITGAARQQPQQQQLHQQLPARPPGPMVRVPPSTAQPTQPSSQPQTPVSASILSHVVRGHGTRWTSTPTPSTPRLEVSGYFEPQSPAFEPLSPSPPPASIPKTSPPGAKKETRKPSSKIDATIPKAPSRLSRSVQKPPATKESTEEPDVGRIIKNEEATPKPFEDAGDTEVDEAGPSKTHGAGYRTTNKRKRQDSPVNRGPPAPPTHVLWTRSFNKVSQSALEQVTSHRHANMFAAPIKPRDAPGYPDIILRPQDLRGIRSAINGGQRAAHALEKTLPDLDPSAMNVWLPISVDLIPPKGIINIAQLERELVHMFANSIMYNQDPDRGVGPSFVRPDSEDNSDEAVGYEVDEDGIVKETRNMFLEVEKLLSDLRSEIERNAQPSTVGRTSVSRGVSVSGGDVSNVEDDAEQQAADAESQNTAKRRRKG